MHVRCHLAVPRSSGVLSLQQRRGDRIDLITSEYPAPELAMAAGLLRKPICRGAVKRGRSSAGAAKGRELPSRCKISWRPLAGKAQRPAAGVSRPDALGARTTCLYGNPTFNGLSVGSIAPGADTLKLPESGHHRGGFLHKIKHSLIDITFHVRHGRTEIDHDEFTWLCCVVRCERPRYFSERGSKACCMASPRKLTAITVTKIRSPG